MQTIYQTPGKEGAVFYFSEYGDVYDTAAQIIACGLTVKTKLVLESTVFVGSDDDFKKHAKAVFSKLTGIKAY